MDCCVSIRDNIVGFFGSFATWVDASVFNLLLDAKVNVDVIGPHSHPQFNTLLRHPRFKYYGVLPHKQLVTIAHTWKCGLIPFIESNLTKCVDPVKFYEYNAMGLPVVATELAEIQLIAACMPIEAAPMLVPARHPVSFYRAVKKMMEEDSPEKRQARRLWASQHSWYSRVHTMLKSVELDYWLED